nr:hypothetical protein [Tanacetum cinerariifolium]
STAAVVPTVTTAPVKVVVPSTRRKRGVIIWDPEKESSTKTPTETMYKDKGKGIMVEEPKPMKKKQQVELDEAYARKLHEELNQDIDWEVAINHVKQKDKENPYVKRYQTMKKRPQTEAQARRNMMMYLKNTARFRLDYFKVMSYDDIRSIFEAKFNSNIEFLLKTKEQIEKEANRAIESINETPAQKAAKRRRRNEEVKDIEELKRHLEIVPDEDDDVFTEATPLARKVLLWIIKSEDLESLWNIVKERFSTSKPNNFTDNFLLTTLRAMFGRPDGQYQVWMSQRSVYGQARVKSWKLLESCGVHIVALTTTQLIMLVERRYPLSRKQSVTLPEAALKQPGLQSQSENKGKVLTKMELVLEQTQQGTSYEVSVSTEGVEELERKVKIKGEKKEALLTLRTLECYLKVLTMTMEILPELTSNKLCGSRDHPDYLHERVSDNQHVWTKVALSLR